MAIAGPSYHTADAQKARLSQDWVGRQRVDLSIGRIRSRTGDGWPTRVECDSPA
jgi:hypothetical protein